MSAKRMLFVFLISCALLTITSHITFANSGCCSRHGGVCGCSCCDGTSLSAKCAPYYSGCGSSKKTPTKSFGHLPETYEPLQRPEKRPVPTSGTVFRVIDGDTIVVDGDDHYLITVRLIGIDAPELTKIKFEAFETQVDIGIYNQMAVQAYNHLKALVDGKHVRLVAGEPDTDIYRRYLRYVYLGDQDIGAKMIEDGYAASYKKFQHQKLNYYNSIEAWSKMKKNGLWSTVELHNKLRVNQ